MSKTRIIEVSRILPRLRQRRMNIASLARGSTSPRCPQAALQSLRLRIFFAEAAELLSLARGGAMFGRAARQAAIPVRGPLGG